MTNPNEYIINPDTNRAIKIGSKVFNSLVRNNQLSGHKQVPRPKGRSIVKAFENRSAAETYRNKLNKGNKDKSHSFSLDKTATKVVKKRNKSSGLKAVNIVNNVSEKASELIKEVPNISEIEKSKLKSMILQRLISNSKPHATIKNTSIYEEDNSVSDYSEDYETHYVDSDYPQSAMESDGFRRRK